MPRPSDSPDHSPSRDQAVLELLRELQAGGPPREEATDSAKSAREQIHQRIDQPIHRQTSQQRSIPVAFLLPTAEVPLQRVSCNSCGWENPADHSFCSMCGEPLANQTTSDPCIADFSRAEPAPADSSLPLTNLQSDPLPLERSVEGRVENQIEDQIENQTGRSLSDDLPHPLPHFAPPSGSYRVYVIAALAILTVGLIVFLIAGLPGIVWRSRQTNPEVSKSTPQVPPAVPRQAAAPIPDRTSNRASAPTPVKATRSTQTARRAAIPAEKSPAPKPANGAEELAIAQSYLSGTDGREHNSDEAVQWLWKAVAKRNTDATFRLADLYLKGEGVPKNCEQARVLLDAAARKGIKDAGEQLRHLQSFGCE